ncbi:MAG: MFS transporter, partial [Dehalococcoidia bacterium]
HRARAVPGELRSAWAIIRGDRLTTLAMLQLSTGGMLLFVFALLAPRFVKDVLEKNPDNSVFIFWPLGLGAILALRLLTILGRRYSPTGIVTVGLFGLAGAIAAMGAVDFLVDFLQDEQPWGRLGPDQILGESLLVIVTVVLAFPMGIAYALVNAPAQTVLHERAPADMRGRVFSAQLMLANAISMFALLFIGGLTDAVGVAAVLFVVGVDTLGMAFFSVYMRRLAHAEAKSLAEAQRLPKDAAGPHN